MRVLIIGGAGMVGRKLSERLLDDGFPGQEAPEITVFDIATDGLDPRISDAAAGDFSDQVTLETLAKQRFDVIYQLASIVSGEAEADFDKGWRVNLWPMWHFLEALRAEHEVSGGAYRPRFIFTSSIAVFGGPYPEAIGDDFLTSPQTSYGAQKASCEMLVQDFTRKGFIDGMSLRLPTICVRPGKPNLAASSFFSGIIREPLNGETAFLPVPETIRHTHASPRSAGAFLRHAGGLEEGALGARTALNLPGVSVTVAEQIEALERVAGTSVVKHIKRAPDDSIMAIVSGWPTRFDPQRALDLGFRAEETFDEIIETYIREDLPKDPRQA